MMMAVLTLSACADTGGNPNSKGSSCESPHVISEGVGEIEVFAYGDNDSVSPKTYLTFCSMNSRLAVESITVVDNTPTGGVMQQTLEGHSLELQETLEVLCVGSDGCNITVRRGVEGAPIRFMTSRSEPTEQVARITSLSISPSEVSQSSLGMTGDGLEISLTFENFDPIVDVDVFVQLPGGDRFAVKRTFEVWGNSVDVVWVRTDLFFNLELGEYQLGAIIEDESGRRVREENLSSVTVIE